MAENLATVDYLPIWKKNSTVEDWLLEVAAVARKHPQRFHRVVIVFEEELPDNNTKYGYYCKNVTTTEVIGLLELGKMTVHDYTSR